MILMGTATILYEYKREVVYSLAIISILLFSLYILLYFPEGLTMDIKIEYCKVQ
jgi:hypothetical protein